jgi:flagella basal body P-ring formation protein FlgA
MMLLWLGCTFLTLQGNRLQITLPREVAIQTSHLTLKDVVQFDSDQDRQSYGDLPLGPAPRPGQTKRLSSGFLVNYLGEQGIEVKILGAKATDITYRLGMPGELGTQATLEGAVRDFLHQNDGPEPSFELQQLRCSGAWTAQSRGKFTVQGPLNGLRPGINAFHVTHMGPEGMDGFSVTARLSRIQTVLRPTRVLLAGELIAPEDIQTVEWSQSLPLRGVFSRVDQVVGARVKRSLTVNDVLRESDVEHQVMVDRNQLVFVNAHREGLSVRMQAKSLDRAGLGERIRLRNPQSGKVLVATVTGRGEAEIQF